MKRSELRIGSLLLGKETGEECEMQHVCMVIGLDGSEEQDLLNSPITVAKSDINLMSTDGNGELEFEAIHCDALEPILLTEEWLLKLGFEKVNHIDEYSFYSMKSTKKNRQPSIVIHDDYTSFNGSKVSHCKYVHQLQNLYLALTGDDLTF